MASSHRSVKTQQKIFIPWFIEDVGFGELSILETIHQKTLPSCEIKLEDQELSEIAGLKEGMVLPAQHFLGFIALQEAIAIGSTFTR